ncbi:MAG: hybrid sensor histidine kinase/response regulator, partial [Proteobacteria bacterium]
IPTQGKVLIVDDSSEACAIMKTYLKGSAFSCDAVTSGLKALELLEYEASSDAPFDVVFIDKLMPELSGYELLDAIRKNPNLDNLKLVLVTADHSDAEEMNAKEAGFDSYLSKPVRRIDLESTLQRLLVPDAASSLPESEDPNLAEIKSKGLRVLVADDIAVNRVIAVALLEKLGVAAQAVATGREAVDALSKQDFDLVFMDCQMPELDGYEATVEIRNLENENSAIPIVALTASATTDAAARCISSGMNGVITKPIRPHALSAALLQYA